MFDEPNERPAERSLDPLAAAREKFDEFRMHAELAAVFEGTRKFDARIIRDLGASLARDMQQSIARLEKSRAPDTPILPKPEPANEAARLLNLATACGLSTNDYHVHRRPGEVLVVRWLAGDEIETFYERLQAHFDAALHQYRDEERQSHGWKQDPQTMAYLDALDKIDVRMSDRYLRDVVRQHNIFVLSTQAADELDILHLADYVMGVSAEEIVGAPSTPPEEPTERDRAWFFKLFALRGVCEGMERMCFFSFLQKASDGAW